MKSAIESMPEGVPDGFVIEMGEQSLSIINRYRDLGDAFGLGFLGLVVVLFVSGIGGKIFGAAGVASALALSSPLWGWLCVGALKRMINTTRVTVTPGAISVHTGPIARGGRRNLQVKEIKNLTVRSFENTSTTRGGKAKVTKTFSIWLVLTGGGELCLLEPIDIDAHARALEKKMSTLLKS